MPYRTILYLIALLSILVSRKLPVDAGNKNTVRSSERQEGGKKAPPSRRYRDYASPIEEEHRIAEEFSWLQSNRLNWIIASTAGAAALFAAGSFAAVIFQANIARNLLVESTRAWISPELPA